MPTTPKHEARVDRSNPLAQRPASTTQALRTRGPLSCSILPIVRSCLCGCRTVKGVKTAWLGNAVAMMHYLRIVKASGRQKRHGHDHKDKAHATHPIWRGARPATVRSHPGSIQQIETLRSGIQSLASTVERISQKQLPHAHTRATDAVKQAEDVVKRNPIVVVAIALGLGLLIGVLVQR